MDKIAATFEAIRTVSEACWLLIPVDPQALLFVVALFVVGVFASFINMLSGGGSMLVLGLMMIFGIDPIVANATNRVGVLVSTATGAAAYKSENATKLKESLKLGIWSVPGAIAGAFFSVQISGDIYEKVIAGVMILLVAGMFIPKNKTGDAESVSSSRWIGPAMILVGLYGGFIQVGVGIVIFAALRHIGNMELMRINVHRVFIVLIFIIPSMLVFVWSGKIHWGYAAALCAGNAIGSWITVKWTLKKGEKLIRIGLAVTIVMISVKLIAF